jgi:hypothetical protein
MQATTTLPATNSLASPSATSAGQRASVLAQRKSLLILVALLIVVAVLHAQNLFQYPYYQDAEGTLVANSQALLTQGRLSPYTYAYEEPPVGTFVLSAWLSVTGGTSTFGYPINTGRVLMLILSLLSTALLYGIARQSTHSDLAATITALLFAFSPLSGMLQRTVLTENIMLVFLLGAVYLILGENRTLGHYLLSAVLCGLAVLSKGAAIFFLPAFLYTIRLQANGHHKRFATALWGTLLVCVLTFYPLYALMKQELFPQGWLLGGDFPHVSLLSRLLDRGPDTGRFLNLASGLGSSFAQWVNLKQATADPLLVYGGVVAALFLVVLCLDKRPLRPLVALLVCSTLYLLLGGQIVLSSALLVLPFLALALGVLLASLANALGKLFREPLLRAALAGLAAVILLYPFWGFYLNRVDLYTTNQINGQLAAVDWLRANVPSDATVVTDNFAFSALRPSLPNTQYYWKVDTDPAIRFTQLNDDPCHIDYVLYTPQVAADITTYHLDLLQRTLSNSAILFAYPNNGWPLELRQVHKLGCKSPTTSDTNTTSNTTTTIN